MKKIFLILTFSLSLSSIFSAAVVNDFFGKVKVKFDGETTWSSIYKGMELPTNATVSTGFNSKIILDLGNATLDVLPLTRMTIGEIKESQGTINTSLFLQGGKVKADVKKIEGTLNDFKIKSPVATASVRGTAFEFSGNTLKVVRGEVAFTPNPRKKATPKAPSAGDAETDKVPEEVIAIVEEVVQGVAVRAGGSTQMSSPESAPIKPKAMAEKVRSIEASTKPEVIKTTAAAALGLEISGSDTPVPSVVQAAVAGITRITITINPVEE